MVHLVGAIVEIEQPLEAVPERAERRELQPSILQLSSKYPEQNCEETNPVPVPESLSLGTTLSPVRDDVRGVHPIRMLTYTEQPCEPSHSAACPSPL